MRWRRLSDSDSRSTGLAFEGERRGEDGGVGSDEVKTRGWILILSLRTGCG